MTTASPPVKISSMRFTYAAEARPIDGFTIRRGIHRGGFGEVYYAVSDAGKEVALKLLTHDLDTELRGIRQCLNLKHPNLVTLFDVRTDEHGDQWVVMEYVQGASLDDVLRSFPNGLPLEEVRQWMRGLLAGVEFLHDRGIVHRDLKPANVYRENGTVKIGDVGLSKMMAGGRRAQHTEAVGTVYYMAPEVMKGQYGPEIDVYGLGVMLYEMLTGKLPFDGETTGEILMKQLAEPPDLSTVPTSLRPVLQRALQKDPQQRTPSITAMREDLQQAWAGEPLPEPLPESAFIPPVPPRLANTTAEMRRPPLPPVTPRVTIPPRSAPVRQLVPPTSPPDHRKHKHVEWDWWPWVILAAVLFVPWDQFPEMARVQPRWMMLLGIGGCGFAVARWIKRRQTTSPGAFPISLRFGSLPATNLVEQYSASVLLGALASAGLSLGGLWVLREFDFRGVPDISVQTQAFFALVAVLGTTVLQSLHYALRAAGRSFADTAGLVWMVGGLFGVMVAALDQFLLLDLMHTATTGFLTPWPAMSTKACFWWFAITWGCQAWWLPLSPDRSQRATWWCVVAAAGIGAALAGPMRFDGWTSAVWAGSMTLSMQLAAPWRPALRHSTMQA